MSDALVDLVQQALHLVLLLSVPPIAAIAVTALVVGVFQAMTQVQDPAIAQAAKIAAAVVSLMLAGPWIAARAMAFATAAFDLIPALQ